jgi:hypothetical protein
MCEYLKLKTEIWNLYVKCLEFEILKIKMSEFGWMNIKSSKLKTEIWNLFVKCLEEIWNFENWNVWILKPEMSEYWRLKTKMFKY